MRTHDDAMLAGRAGARAASHAPTVRRSHGLPDGPLSVDRILQLQRSAGNAAVARLVKGRAASARPRLQRFGGRAGGRASGRAGGCCAGCGGKCAPGHQDTDESTESTEIRASAPIQLQRGIWNAITEGAHRAEAALGVAGADCEVAADQKRDWIAAGMRGPQDLRPPTGLGGFRAQYDPAAKKLIITLAGGVSFTDGITLTGGAVVPASGLGPAVQAANAISLLPPDQRAAAVAHWKWSGDQAPWLARFTSAVTSAWSEKFQFHGTKDHWTDLEANVDVEVHVHEGAKAADEHLSINVFKVPDDVSAGVGVVNSGAGGALDNRMTLGSTDVAPRTDNLLDSRIRFAPTSDGLSPDGTTDVTTLANTFKAGSPTCAMCGRMVPGLEGPVLTINVNGRAGPDNAASVAARFQAIKAGLTAAGFVDADARVRQGASGVQAATDTIGATTVAEGGVAQIVAAHESGHMFGLGDQYAVGAGSAITGTGLAAGAAAAHDQEAKDMGLPGSIAENNDNVMALGSVVRPEAYSTFFWALKQVTAMDDWALGPPIPVPSCDTNLNGPGDFPAPQTDPPTAVA